MSAWERGNDAARTAAQLLSPSHRSQLPPSQRSTNSLRTEIARLEKRALAPNFFAPLREIFIAGKKGGGEEEKRKGNYFVGSVAGSNRGIHPAWSVFADSASRTPGTRFLDCSPVNRKRGKSGYSCIYIYVYVCVYIFGREMDFGNGFRERSFHVARRWPKTGGQQKGRAVWPPPC